MVWQGDDDDFAQTATTIRTKKRKAGKFSLQQSTLLHFSCSHTKPLRHFYFEGFHSDHGNYSDLILLQHFTAYECETETIEIESCFQRWTTTAANFSLLLILPPHTHLLTMTVMMMITR